jgi:hypothetical protein
LHFGGDSKEAKFIGKNKIGTTVSLKPSLQPTWYWREKIVGKSKKWTQKCQVPIHIHILISTLGSEQPLSVLPRSYKVTSNINVLLTDATGNSPVQRYCRCMCKGASPGYTTKLVNSEVRSTGSCSNFHIIVDRLLNSDAIKSLKPEMGAGSQSA